MEGGEESKQGGVWVSKKSSTEGDVSAHPQFLNSLRITRSTSQPVMFLKREVPHPPQRHPTVTEKAAEDETQAQQGVDKEKEELRVVDDTEHEKINSQISSIENEKEQEKEIQVKEKGEDEIEKEIHEKAKEKDEEKEKEKEKEKDEDKEKGKEKDAGIPQQPARRTRRPSRYDTSKRSAVIIDPQKREQFEMYGPQQQFDKTSSMSGFPKPRKIGPYVCISLLK